VIAYTFTIRTRERRQLIGQAAICLEARYVSVQWTTSPCPDRKFATRPDQVIVQLDQRLRQLQVPR
jgi:hypothetical protein